MRDKNIDFLPIAATSDAELQIEQGPGQEPDKEKNTRPISEKAYLVRKSAGEKVEITKEEFMIGRGTKRVDYSIYDDKTVSRLHCRIITDKGGTTGRRISYKNLERRLYVSQIIRSAKTKTAEPSYFLSY